MGSLVPFYHSNALYTLLHLIRFTMCTQNSHIVRYANGDETEMHKSALRQRATRKITENNLRLHFRFASFLCVCFGSFFALFHCHDAGRPSARMFVWLFSSVSAKATEEKRRHFWSHNTQDFRTLERKSRLHKQHCFMRGAVLCLLVAVCAHTSFDCFCSTVLFALLCHVCHYMQKRLPAFWIISKCKLFWLLKFLILHEMAWKNGQSSFFLIHFLCVARAE